MNNEDFVVVRQNDTVERLPPSYLLAKRVKELENRVQDLMADKKWLHNRLDELSTQNKELQLEMLAMGEKEGE